MSNPMPPPTYVKTRFTEVGPSLAEFLLPDRLLLKVDTTAGAIRLTNWPAYECAVRTMLRLRGVETHLSQVEPRDPKKKKAWNHDDKTCKAIIMLNVSNFESVFDTERMGKKTADIWRDLESLYEASCGNAASAEQLVEI
ncbi:hypothetical protein GSI_02173 [Ganoderma sinense ZZ0214-1]|uniref:Uncharacterized protein n=1 Tax=Ganoderma sinense ZZ0214-1 TaxID=1077348 RepID=A0A2G8SNT8_9APHY|nr:hypothetical protein GSI_02173 [Ganoderma sinense ZZ0214-1]